jgi:eukaryotic-like serine/threonine-protein kinase
MSASAKRFTPLGPLLAGSGSRAFLGVEARADGPRAVVLIWAPDEVVRDAERLARLRRDTEQASRLDHPNIIHVVGFEQLDEGWARIVSFADGESLRRIMDTAKAMGRELPPELGARVVADACFGVHYAHELGEIEDDRPLVHGNLRPEVLMVSFNGTTKVTGYGALEVAPKPEGGKLSARQIYHSPEQIAGGLAAASRSSDIYSLGVVLYQVLAGRPPFLDAEQDLELAILTKQPERIPLVTAPEGLVDVAMKAMSKKAGDRYPTALALREAIEAALGPSVPTTEELAGFLAGVFPPNSREREARRQLLASVMSVSGMHMIPENEVLPPPPAEVPPPSEAKPSLAAAAPSAPRKAESTPPLPQTPPSPRPVAPPRRTVSEPEMPREGSSLARIVIPLTIVLAIAIPIWLRSQRPAEKTPAESKAVEMAKPPVPSASPPSQPVAAAPHAVPAPEVAPPIEPPHAPVPEPIRTGTLEVDTDPRGEVLVDGKSAGRAPVKVVVPAGRHSIRLVDKAKGIDVGRSVSVGAGKQSEEKIILGSATLTLTAPAGSAIFLDGKKVGTAPVQPLNFYEGPHRVMVTFNGAKMEKKFNARGGDRLTLDVQPTP